MKGRFNSRSSADDTIRDTDFPIIDLMGEVSSAEWWMKHLHPEWLKCPHCQAIPDEARLLRVNRGSELRVYLCRACGDIHNLYSGTIFEGSQLTPPQVVLLLRGVLQGQSNAQIAREIGLTEKTVLKWQHRLQANVERLRPDTPVPD